MENFYKLHDELLYHEKVNNPEVHPMLIIEFDQSSRKLNEMIRYTTDYRVQNTDQYNKYLINVDDLEILTKDDSPFFVKNSLNLLSDIFQGSNKNYAASRIRKATITSLPNTLFAWLKRFKEDKNGQKVKIKDQVIGTENIAVDSEGKDVKYTLSGFTVHNGDGIKGSHHVAYVKKGNTWYYTSDTTVKTVNDAIAASQDAYLLFYTKV